MALFARLTLAVGLIACCSPALADGVTPFCDVLCWHASAEASSVWSNEAYEHASFSAENVPFDWNAGFRVGFGHKLDEQSWDVKLYWTYFRTSADADAAVDNTKYSALIPEFFSGLLGGSASASQGSIDWNLNYNTIDLELGRSFAIGQSAWIRPSMGLKAAFIEQDVNLSLERPPSALPSMTAVEQITHDFWGVGPSFGISGGWRLPKCDRLSLVGSFAADFLFGQWNVNDAYTRTDTVYALGEYGAFTTSMTDSCLGVPTLRYFVGLEWVRQGRVTLTAHAGYELQWWANQQRMLAFQQLPMHGDLTFEGLTCGVSLGF